MIELFDHPLWARLGLTLAHFVWQGMAIALLLGAVLLILRRRSPHARYVASTVALLALLACPLVTFWQVGWAAPVIPLQAETHAGAQETPADRGLPMPSGKVQPDPRVASDSGALGGEDSTLLAQIMGESDTGMAGQAPSAEHPPASHVEVQQADDALPLAGSVARPPSAGEDHRGASPMGQGAMDVTAARWWQDAEARQRVLGLGLSAAAAIWCLGVALLAVRLMSGWLALRRWRTGSSLELPEAVAAAVGRIAGRLGLNANVDVRVSEQPRHPLAFGLLRPVVLLPLSAVTHLPRELLEAMIAHELAHIRRHDLWVNLLQRIVETLLFYHPAVWWVSGRMRLERELCCDDLAVAVTGRRVEYAEALVALARQHQPAAALALSAGMFGARTTLTRRVRRILQLPQPLERTRAWLAGPITLALVGAFVLMVAIPPALSRDDVQGASEEAASEVAEPRDEPASPPDARIEIARQLVSEAGPVATQLEIYRLHVGTYPKELRLLHEPPQDEQVRARWRGPYVESLDRLKDPWGRPLQYQRRPPEGYELRSLGPDGRDGTADDVVRPGRDGPPQALGIVLQPAVVPGWPETDEAERTYSFAWRSVPLAQAVREFGEMAGLAVIGLDWLPANDLNQKLTLESTRILTFDEALLSVNQVIENLGYWMIHREHLVIRRLTEWYRHIPAENLFTSVEDYRSARLPQWEIASVLYQARELAGETLIAVAVGGIPPNTARGVLSEDAHSMRLTGFVYFLDWQLQVLAKHDVPATQPAGRAAIRPIRPGDWLQIQAMDFFVRDQWADLSQTVDENGEIYLPSIGRVRAAGSTPSALRDRITALARDDGIYPEDTHPPVFVELQPAAPGAPPASPSRSTPARRPGTTQPAVAGPEAEQPVPVRAMANGIITEVKVRPGQRVSKGELLVQLDDREIRLELEAASVKQKSAGDHLKRMQVNWERGTVDAAERQKAETEARVAQLELQRWELRLERTRITSPVEGVVVELLPERSLIGKKISAGDTILLIGSGSRMCSEASPTEDLGR